ncbi:MAG: hypothetical protein ACKO7B_19145, partial [Flavobacteriales bacterium]
MKRPLSLRSYAPALMSAIALFLAFGLQMWYGNSVSDPQRILSRAEARMRSLDDQMVRRMQKLCADTSDEGFHRDFLHQESSDEGTSYYVYQNGRLKEWTDNGPALPFEEFKLRPEGGLLHLA